jgi:hypothetical protein
MLLQTTRHQIVTSAKHILFASQMATPHKETLQVGIHSTFSVL